MTSEDIDPKVQALCLHFGVTPDQVSERRDEYSVEGEPGTYRVLSDDEADQEWDQALESYLDDCLLCELPDIAKQYFDREAWKRDARFDGRAHCLARYDGNEYEAQVDGEWFYIYRET